MEGRNAYKKGLWTEEEDTILINYVSLHGIGKWNSIAKATGLKRCGKSCRLRWMNHLTPNIKRDNFSKEEDDLIIRLHNLLGNRWSLIAGRIPGRTDNQVKNHWNTSLSKKIGIKKWKNKLSSQTRYSESMKKISMDANSNLPSNFNGGIASQHVLGDEIHSSFGAKDGLENSSLFTSDDLTFHNPNIMDFLEDNFLDFDWHDL